MAFTLRVRPRTTGRPSSSSPYTTPSEPNLRTCQTDNFHIRSAMQAILQLVDKNPGKAVSFFSRQWLLLRNMSVIMIIQMRQLRLSNPSVSLCLPISQDSLYKIWKD